MEKYTWENVEHNKKDFDNKLFLLKVYDEVPRKKTQKKPIHIDLSSNMERVMRIELT